VASNRSVLITGASSGIGAIYADRFAGRGHDLVLVSFDAEEMEAVAKGLARKHGVAVDTICADLTVPAELATVESRLREDRHIGILINNAGASLAGRFAEQPTDTVARLVSLNAMAVLRLASAVAPRFVEAGDGAIVNVASILALSPENGMSAYTATKAFVMELSLGLGLELGYSGVYVQTLVPGPTRTPLWERSGYDIDTLPATMDADALVDAALVGFDRREALTFPSLYEIEKWERFEEARQNLMASISPMQVARRYQTVPHPLR
jgi:short-subunit dehydrogenase